MREANKASNVANRSNANSRLHKIAIPNRFHSHYLNSLSRPLQTYTMQPNLQYQHYIPPFIPRNFSHPFKPPKRKGSQKHDDSPREKRIRKGDKALNIVDNASDEPQICEVPVTRWFGQENLYNDAAHTISLVDDMLLNTT